MSLNTQKVWVEFVHNRWVGAWKVKQEVRNCKWESQMSSRAAPANTSLHHSNKHPTNCVRPVLDSLNHQMSSSSSTSANTSPHHSNKHPTNCVRPILDSSNHRMSSPEPPANTSLHQYHSSKPPTNCVKPVPILDSSHHWMSSSSCWYLPESISFQQMISNTLQKDQYLLFLKSGCFHHGGFLFMRSAHIGFIPNVNI